MINLGKFSEEKFQALKSQISGGVKSLGKMSEQGFEAIKQGISQLPVLKLAQGDLKGYGQSIAQASKQFKDPMTALNFMPMGIAKPIVKQINNLTKDEMIKAIDYLRGKKGFNQLAEENITKLVEKFGGNLRWSKAKISDFLQNLVEKTKTIDISNRKPLFKSTSLNQFTKGERGLFTGSKKVK